MLPIFTELRPPCERTRRYNRPTMPPVTPELVFHGAHSPWTLLAHLTAVGLTLVLIVLLLRYERRLVSRTVGNWLLGLRVSVLAVVLMTLLQPVKSALKL